MDQLKQVAVEKLALLPAEHGSPGRVKGEAARIQPHHHHQITRQPPDAVPLAGALGDPRLQRQVDLAQGLHRFAAQAGHGEVGADPGQQLAGRERLGQIVVGAGVDAFDPGLLAGTGRQQDHRAVAQSWGSARSARSRPNPSRRGIITSDSTRSGGLRPGRRQRRLAVAHRLDLIALAGQQAAAHTRACRRCRRPAEPRPPAAGILRRGGHRSSDGWHRIGRPHPAASAAPPRHRPGHGASLES